MINILIIAIDHGVQLAADCNDSSELLKRKAALETQLRREITTRSVRFIAEESHPDKSTIAKALADANTPVIPWKNIYMTPDERTAASIKDALDNRSGHLDFRRNKWIEHRMPEDEIREDFFVQEIIKGANGAESVLIVCGDMHVEALKEKLENIGHHVQTNHDAVPDKDWQ